MMTFLRAIAAGCLLSIFAAAAVHASVNLLLVPPTGAVAGAAGLTFTLYVNNPTEVPEVVELPTTIKAEYASATGHGFVLLSLADPQKAQFTVAPMTRQTVSLRMTEALNATAGFVSLRLSEPGSNAIMFELASTPLAASAAPAAVTSPSTSTSPAPSRHPLTPARRLDLTTDLESIRLHVSSYEPVYFAVGWRDRLNARFQFSFKYRVFEPGLESDSLLQKLPREIYGAYTQNSIWDLEALSRPFYDTAYKPTVFLLHEFNHDVASKFSFSIQAGAQHESNGRGGGTAPLSRATSGTAATSSATHSSDSRSVNTLYVAPKARWVDDDGRFFEVGVRVSAYGQLDENPDLPHYRGWVEATFRAGYDRGFQLSAYVRGHPSGHGSAEFNATWPASETPLLKFIVPRTLGGYAQIQYFNGYGESLLDYDLRRRDQLRFGVMLVR